MRVLIFLILLILIFFHTRGVVMHDEGYILQSALRFLHGEIPYKDFHFVYTPGSIFITSLSFFLFSPSILSTRILMIGVSLLSSFLIYKTVFLSTKNKLYAILSVLVYVAWGPTHINFSWPVMFCIPLGIALCYLLLKFFETKLERYLFFAGVSAFLLFLFKQNFGVAGIGAVIIFFIFVEQTHKISSILSFLYGFFWSLILFCIYLLTTNSFAYFVYDMHKFTLERIIFQKDLNTSFIYYDTLTKSFLRTLLYLSPFIISLSALIIIFIRKRYHLLHLTVFVILFYILGIRPTTDYLHLVPLLSLVGIPSVLFLRLNTYSTLRILIILGLAGLIALGFQTALFKGYYRWEDPLIKHNYFYSNPRVFVFVNEKTNNDFSNFLEITNSNSKTNDYLFINAYAPMFYFISNRIEATEHNYLTYDFDEKTYEYNVILNLSKKKVPIVLIQKGRNEKIIFYIRQYYSYFTSFGDYEVYVKE